MNPVANNIRNRLSLRPPQEISLNILAELADKLTLSKNCDLHAELDKVRAQFPTCSDFERKFPSLCFSLATGVGKTRLMGAFAAYLHLSKGIKNFFVLAPNLTIYNKLIEDFSNTASPKYVFQGIGEFVHNRPLIITGDNYREESQTQLFKSAIHINIFNISKINAEARKGKEPLIKRLSEYLGESYFNYLSNLDDLVLMMDESHHYRADRGMEVINELNPILGLELTATPQVERGGKAIKFKNVVYEYSLAAAIRDGFVKEPAVATRRNFDPSQYSVEDLDRIKLEDGVRIHENTKVALDIYARDNKVRQVKPFVLVVAKDTDHAAKLKAMITSPAFFDGYYADKVMEIHSNQSGEEKDENIAQLLHLELPANKIEIVIHVNMLKEGWDVTNLYTIIPLRAANVKTLIEQTIGRGLRLPYGRRTGDNKVDKLTVVAHDKFQAIIDEANKPDSLLRKENFIEIDLQELGRQQVVITAEPVMAAKLTEEEKRIEEIAEPEAKKTAQINLEASKAILEILPEMNASVKSVAGLKTEEIKKIALEKIRERIANATQRDLFAAEIVKQAEQHYDSMVSEFTANIIEIPRIAIQQTGNVKSGFRDFNLDVKNLNYQPVSEEILIKKLREDGSGLDIISGEGNAVADEPESILVNELMNCPEIDYDSQSEQLFKLATQATAKFRSYLDAKGLMNIVQYHKRDIAKYIYTQMMEHFFYETPAFEKPILTVKPYSRIEEHNLLKDKPDQLHDLRETINPTSAIPSKVFCGFKKACHQLYKFDSKTEKDFAAILEDDKAVLKWLRPAAKQFSIWWRHNSRQYQPDFVVETTAGIYMVETKKESDIDTTDVQEKSQAAMYYCKNATQYTTEHGGKPWRYVLIPHNTVMANMSFDNLVRHYEQKG